MSKTKQTLGTRIRTIRLGAGLTQQELADEVGVSRMAISRLENRRASAEGEVFVLMKIAQALGVRLGDLVEGDA